ncbi:MAG: hypothetical protein ABIQ73_24685 [Acidimicrobiales bacterium]
MGGLSAPDQYGLPAYCCAADGHVLESIAGMNDVLCCPVCGHRSDEPGNGVLGDAFDIVHRQWGLRGDPHAWRAMRNLLATIPTPPDRDAVRDRFVDGLRQVAHIDIDQLDGQPVYREHLDHGGMSGGVVNVEWWRTKGIPLLVDRAVSRRAAAPGATDPPHAAPRSVRSVATGVGVWALVLAIPIALIGSGGWLLYQRAIGTRVKATVLTCDSSGNFRRYGTTFRTDCVAQWTIDGRVIIGGFDGGNGSSDVGKQVDATVRGGTAYSRSLGLPILLIAFGLPFLVIPFFAIKRRIVDHRNNPVARARSYRGS